jgi:hypothetical protein
MHQIAGNSSLTSTSVERASPSTVARWRICACNASTAFSERNSFRKLKPTQRDDHTDDQHLSPIPDDRRNDRRRHQQQQQIAAQLAHEHRHRADAVRAKHIRPVDNEPPGGLDAGKTSPVRAPAGRAPRASAAAAANSSSKGPVSAAMPGRPTRSAPACSTLTGVSPRSVRPSVRRPLRFAHMHLRVLFERFRVRRRPPTGPLTTAETTDRRLRRCERPAPDGEFMG